MLLYGRSRILSAVNLCWAFFIPFTGAMDCKEALECHFGSRDGFNKVKTELHEITKFADPNAYCTDAPMCDYPKYTYLVSLPQKYYACDPQFGDDVDFFVSHCLRVQNECCRDLCSSNPFNKRLTCNHSDSNGKSDIASSVLLALSLISILINIAFDPVKELKTLPKSQAPAYMIAPK